MISNKTEFDGMMTLNSTILNEFSDESWPISINNTWNHYM